MNTSQTPHPQRVAKQPYIKTRDERIDSFKCPNCGKPPQEPHGVECVTLLLSMARCYLSNKQREQVWREKRMQAEDRALAIKHENNKLRKANEKLRVRNSTLEALNGVGLLRDSQTTDQQAGQ